MGIRVGDTIMVMTGKERGKTGKVRSIDWVRQRVIVEKLNIVKRHQKPTQKNRQGGVVEKEASIHVSNVLFYDEKAGKPTRLGSQGTGKEKMRISRRTGAEVARPSRAS